MPPTTKELIPKALLQPWPGQGQPIRHLYIHIPFCVRKCPYCGFYSEPYTPEAENRFVTALLRELEFWEERLAKPLQTLYFGGGTPTLLRPESWERILSTFAARGLLPVEEFSVECNPATLTPETGEILIRYGLQRLSIGAQSFDPQTLQTLGRIHGVEEIFQTVSLAQEIGVPEIGLDLIFAVPGQSLEQWEQTLKTALSLPCVHLSCYELTYEDDTPFFQQLQAGRFQIDEDLACAMYERAQQQAAAHGFEQYEISNWARRSAEPATPPSSGRVTARPWPACRHNIAYWKGKPYLGLGPAASSFVDGVRWTNKADWRGYCQALEEKRLPEREFDALAPWIRACEIAGFGLRMMEGWDLDEFAEVTGFRLEEGWKWTLDRLVDQGWGQWEKNRFRLTPEGLRFADQVALELLP